MYDAIVIGAGPAGLQAALTLGRMHRPTLILDSGEYRNAPVQHMHNVVASDGMPPAQFRATARAQLGEYEDIEIRDVSALSISGDDGDFEVALADGTTVGARRIVLATGMADDLPDIPGLGGLWGIRTFSCPFCDGHEHAGRPIAVFGPAARAEHLIGLLGRIVSQITVYPGASGMSEDEEAAVTSLGALVDRSPVTGVAEADEGVRITTDDGEVVVAGIFVASSTARHRAPFAEQRGLGLLPSGAIEIDDFGRTSEPGIFAAGDLAHRASLPGPMAAVVLAAAAGQLAAVGVIQSLL